MVTLRLCHHSGLALLLLVVVPQALTASSSCLFQIGERVGGKIGISFALFWWHAGLSGGGVLLPGQLGVLGITEVGQSCSVAAQ